MRRLLKFIKTIELFGEKWINHLMYDTIFQVFCVYFFTRIAASPQVAYVKVIRSRSLLQAFESITKAFVAPADNSLENAENL